MIDLVKYHGIKKGYPRLRRYFGKLVAYIQLCRVFTLAAPLLAGLFGVLTPVQNITFGHLVTAIYVGLTLAFSQAAGQCLNQYADLEIDRLVKPYRPLPSGLVTREEALGAAWLLVIFAVGRGFTISMFFGLVVLALIFFAVFYSLAPLSPRKVHPLLNVGWMAVSRGFLPMFAVFSVYGDVHSAWRYSILAFLWVMGFQATKDVADVDADRKFEIKTVPNTYGLRGLVTLMMACTVLYILSAFWFRLHLMLLVVPLGILAAVTTERQTALIENNIAWGCMYVGLSLQYLLMFLIEFLM